MEPDTTTAEPLAHQVHQVLGVPVAVDTITQSLKSLWTENATHTRCSLINFVVYSERPGSLEHNAALLADITSDHACRALIIDAQPCLGTDGTDGTGGTEASTVKAWITAHCHLSQAGGKSMCSEQIAFQLRGDPAMLVPNTVFAHLDSDLPLAFWWQGDFSKAFERHLTGRIDRLVIDSASWSDPKREYATLQKARQQSSARFIVLDLVSTRLFSHRLALAACFDTPEALSGLERIDGVTITHHQNQRFTAQTFAAWMALKAGWNWLSAPSDNALTFAGSNGHSIELAFEISLATSRCPGVAEVKLAGPDVEVRIQPDAGGRYLQSNVTIAGQPHMSYLTPMAARSEASLVSQRLRQPGNDALYFAIWDALLPCL